MRFIQSYKKGVIMFLEAITAAANGGLFGGLLRLVTAYFKDKQELKLAELKAKEESNERAHEIKMQEQLLELEKHRSAAKIEALQVEGDNESTVRQFDAISKAVDTQFKVSKNSDFVDKISRIIRPLITILFVGGYVTIKVVTANTLLNSNIPLLAVVAAIWTPEDFALMSSIIGFWFVGRVYERKPQNRV